MKTIVHKATARTHHQCAWRSTFYSFGQKEETDPERIRFGALARLNDGSLNPDRGVETRSREEMAIITIPLSGKVKESNDRGEAFVLNPEEALLCIDRSGIVHTEYNPSADQANNYLKIGISLHQTNIPYFCRQFSITDHFSSDALSVFLSPENGDGRNPFLPVQAWLSIGQLKKETLHQYTLHDPKSFGVYFFVVEGRISVDGSELSKRDGQGVYGVHQVELKILESSLILAIEVPT